MLNNSSFRPISLRLPYPSGHHWPPPKFGFSRSMLRKSSQKSSPKWCEKSPNKQNPRKTTLTTFSLKPISTYTPVDLKIFLEAAPLVGGLARDGKKHPHTRFHVSKKNFRSTSCTSILKVSKSFRITTMAFHCRSVSAKIWQKPGGPNQEAIHNGFDRDRFWSADSGWFLPALSLV